jgi:hypothetical protein
VIGGTINVPPFVPLQLLALRGRRSDSPPFRNVPRVASASVDAERMHLRRRHVRMAKTDLRQVGKLLSLCDGFKTCFTLEELVAQVMKEWPGEAFETATVWQSLIATNRIRGCGDSPAPRYCVAKRRKPRRRLTSKMPREG